MAGTAESMLTLTGTEQEGANVVPATTAPGAEDFIITETVASASMKPYWEVKSSLASFTAKRSTESHCWRPPCSQHSEVRASLQSSSTASFTSFGRRERPSLSPVRSRQNSLAPIPSMPMFSIWPSREIAA